MEGYHKPPPSQTVRVVTSSAAATGKNRMIAACVMIVMMVLFVLGSRLNGCDAQTIPAAQCKHSESLATGRNSVVVGRTRPMAAIFKKLLSLRVSDSEAPVDLSAVSY